MAAEGRAVMSSCTPVAVLRSSAPTARVVNMKCGLQEMCNVSNSQDASGLSVTKGTTRAYVSMEHSHLFFDIS